VLSSETVYLQLCSILAYALMFLKKEWSEVGTKWKKKERKLMPFRFFFMSVQNVKTKHVVKMLSRKQMHLYVIDCKCDKTENRDVCVSCFELCLLCALFHTQAHLQCVNRNAWSAVHRETRLFMFYVCSCPHVALLVCQAFYCVTMTSNRCSAN